MAEYNKVYVSLKPELPKVIQQEQIYVYAPRSSRAGMKSISSFNITAPVDSVQYDTTDGITVTGNSSLVSEEMSGETVTQNFQSEFRIPIRPGKYINIDATVDNDAVGVKVDDTALALDYWKIKKSGVNTVPMWNANNGTADIAAIMPDETPGTIAYRNSNGDCSFKTVYTSKLKTLNGNAEVGVESIFVAVENPNFVIAKTSTDTGVFTETQLANVTFYKNRGIQYDNKLYYCMDPKNAPNGTLNFVHIDSVQDGNGGYKATGKCFSITVSTREWKVFDLGFGGSGHYTARWDKVNAEMVRLNDAASFPTDVTNFAHRGSVNENYSNPFDNIYPWSGIKLCNISIDLYRNLAAGDSITKCVTAWEGDVDFSYNDANGVWRYRPEFWGKSWEDDTYRYFDVSEKAIGSYVHYPEAIVGRWYGRKENRTIGGEEKDCLIPSVGMPAKSISVSGLHTRAKNFGATLDSIYSVDADTLLCVVEFATMNTQNAIGNGVSNLYRQSSDLIQEDATNSTTVKVLAAAGSAYCIPGAIFDIGTSNGGTQVGSFVVVSATPNVGDAQYLDVTLDQAVTVTGANYWSVHGLVNVTDEAIGSKSGYIGTNGKCNAYYRGIVMFGNMWFYTLGAYENKDDHHIWIANSDEEADNYNALDTTVHYDTGLVLPTAGGYTKKLGLLSRSGLLSIPAFCVETGGDSSNPVGDYFYNESYTYNTVLLRGGHARSGSGDGAFCGYWGNAASGGDWGVSARPRLKNP